MKLDKAVRSAGKYVLSHASVAVPRRFEDRTFSIPVIEGHGLENLRAYEEDMSRIVSTLLDRFPGPVIDIGVNVGQTLLKVKSHDPERRWIGFEPSSFCCHYVSQLIQRNGLTACQIVPIGLSDTAGIVEFETSGPADPQATIVKGFWTEKNARSFRQTIYVQRGDELVGSLGLDAVGFGKIDVEGGELEVVRGLSGTLGRLRFPLVMEILPSVSGDPGAADAAVMLTRRERTEQLAGTLAGLDYRLLRIQPGGRSLAAEFSFEAASFDAALSNYIAMPVEKLPSLEGMLV